MPCRKYNRVIHPFKRPGNRKPGKGSRAPKSRQQGRPLEQGKLQQELELICCTWRRLQKPSPGATPRASGGLSTAGPWPLP